MYLPDTPGCMAFTIPSGLKAEEEELRGRKRRGIINHMKDKWIREDADTNCHERPIHWSQKD